MLVGFLTEVRVPASRSSSTRWAGPKTRALYRDALDAAPHAEAWPRSPRSRSAASRPIRCASSTPRTRPTRRRSTDAPTLHDFLDAEDRAHFDGLRRHLDALGTPYTVDPKLVRGLDYYTRTLFEIKGAHEKLGAGSTLVGGGRYDDMLADLGGPQVPAIGFAAGLERLLIASELEVPATVVDAFVAPLGEAAIGAALVLARDLRRARHPLRGRHARHVAQEPAAPGQRAGLAHGAHPGRRRARRRRRAGEGPRGAHAGAHAALAGAARRRRPPHRRLAQRRLPPAGAARGDAREAPESPPPSERCWSRRPPAPRRRAAQLGRPHPPPRNSRRPRPTSPDGRGRGGAAQRLPARLRARDRAARRSARSSRPSSRRRSAATSAPAPLRPRGRWTTVVVPSTRSAAATTGCACYPRCGSSTRAG